MCASRLLPLPNVAPNGVLEVRMVDAVRVIGRWTTGVKGGGCIVIRIITRCGAGVAGGSGSGVVSVRS